MFRAALWTGGLFAVGSGLVHLLPAGAWVEPLVLAALGAGLILAGGRGAVAARRSSREQRPAMGDVVERAAQ